MRHRSWFSRRSHWFVVAIVVSGFIMSFDLTQAMPPPAGNIFLFKKFVCTPIDVVELRTPATRYWRNDQIPLTIRVKNYAAADTVTISLPPAAGLVYIDHTPAAVTRIAPDWTFRTTLQPNEELSLVVTLQVPVSATPADVTLTATATNSSGIPCQKSTNFTIRPLFDLKVDLTPAGVVQVNEDDRIVYNAVVTNLGASSGSDDLSSEEVFVTIETPAGITELFADASTSPGATVSSNGGRKTVRWTRNPNPFGKNNSFTVSIAYTVTLPEGSYNVRACTGLTNVALASFDSNPANNCTSGSVNNLIVNAMSFRKTWTDNSGTEYRRLNAGDTVQYTLTASNTSLTRSVNNLTITDLLTVDCHPGYPDNCQSAWDGSLTWTNTDGGTISGNKITWVRSFAPDTSQTFTLTGRVVDQATLTQKIQTYGTKQRCNAVGLESSPGTLSPEAKVCFEYIIAADLSASKTFADGTKLKRIRQGAADGFTLNFRNNGPYPSFNTRSADTIIDEHSCAGGVCDRHLALWVPETLDGGVLSGTHNVDWQLDNRDGVADNRFNVGASVTMNPKFVVPCDAPVNRSIDNLVGIAADTSPWDPNPANNNNLNPATGRADVIGTVDPGSSNLGLTSRVDRANVGPGETTVLTLTATNTGASVNVDVPYVTVTTTIPTDFTVTSTSPVATQTGRELKWLIPTVTANSAGVAVGATLQANSNTIDNIVTIRSTARSLAASSLNTCGYAESETPVHVLGAIISMTKDASKLHIARGEPEIDLTLRIVNSSQTIGLTSQSLLFSDNLHPGLDYVGTTSCQLYSPPDAATSSGSCQNNEQEINPQTSVVNGQTKLDWTIRAIPANTAIRYLVQVKAKDTYQPTACPDPANNSTFLTDTTNPDFSKESNLVTINLYSSQCIEGNLYSRIPGAPTTNEGIRITGSDIIIHPLSILSSSTTINCGAARCNNVPIKISQYSTEESVGIKFAKIVKRMDRNIKRLRQQAAPLPVTTISSNFDLLGGASLAEYPDGRVWIVKDNDLVIQTDAAAPIRFSGKGTIIIDGGNVRITGNGRIIYATERASLPGISDKDSLGFIVLPSGTLLDKGRVIIEDAVTQVVGAFYAPGTRADTPNVSTITSASDPGTIIFEGPGITQLRPAKGLFIGRQFIINRSKIVLQYNPLVNASETAPPGFRFVSSPVAEERP